MKVSKVSYVPTPVEQSPMIKNYRVFENPDSSCENLSNSTTLSFLGNVNPYLRDLAKGLTNEFGEKVKPSQLKSVMSKESFLKEIPKLIEQNYIASSENIKSGVFIADLHSHTNYSDGKISVNNMLEQAAEYGNRLKNINGKSFIFALTDHDCIKGNIEALKIISENPSKYENIKFIPASELSFVFPCEIGSRRAELYKTDVQMPEALVFNINPFSETTKTFFKDLYDRRKKMTSRMINFANELIRDGKFSVKEYNQYVLKRREDDYFIMNQHWHILDYIQAKTGVLEAAKQQMKSVRQLTREILSELQKRNIKPYSFNIMNYIKNKGWLSHSNLPEFAYDKLQREFFPHAQANTVKTDVEHRFEDIVNYAQKEDLSIALAHPVYLLQNAKLEDGFDLLKNLLRLAKGRLNFVEKYHQAYNIGKNRDIRTESELNDYNKILDRFEFIKIGGRDNHTIDFAKFAEKEHFGENWGL